MDNDTQLAVLENVKGDDNDGDRDRSRSLLVGGAIAAVVLAVMITALALMNPGGEKEGENMLRAGSPEFEAYKDKVVLKVDPDSKMTHPNMIGMWQLAMTATLSNQGDRELVGVEVVGKMIDLEDKAPSRMPSSGRFHVKARNRSSPASQ